jgi:hypothetical protein
MAARHAAASSVAADVQMGCILRHPGQAARFVPAAPLDKEASSLAVSAERQARPASRFVDPCALGQQRTLSVAQYRRIAALQPGRYRPLDPLPVVEDMSARLSGGHHVPSYRYVAVGEELPPQYLFFDPAAIGRVSTIVGTAYAVEGDLLVPHVALFDRGHYKFLGEGLAGPVNAAGTIGGALLIDPDNFLTQAALFHGERVTVIPLLPGQVTSGVLDLNDAGQALVFSIDAAFENVTLSVWDGHRSVPLDFGPEVPFSFFEHMNNAGLISGTTLSVGGDRGFVHDWRSGKTTLLQPVTEPHAWALDINNRGEVLGYSFIPGGIERIGVWDAKGEFRTRFVEGTAEIPTISNALRFNDNGLIVITRVSSPADEAGHSYLLDRRNRRVDLEDVTKDLVVERGSLWFVLGINNLGNLFGLTLTDDGSSYGFELTRAAR